MDFKPTTTRSAFLLNVTSASDTFPGWPNGVARPSAIGRGPLGIPQIVIAHDVGWWGSKSHPSIGYDSSDPLQAAKTVNDGLGRGVKAWSQLWHGSTSFEDKSARAKLTVCEALGAKLLICVGSSTASLRLNDPTFTVAQRTVVLNAILDYLRVTFFKSPAYLRYGSLPVLQFFGISGVDWTAARAHVSSWASDQPMFAFRIEKSDKDGKYYPHAQADIHFGWTHCDDAWATAVLALGKPVIIGINGGFNSSIKTAPVLCTWGSGTIIDQQGGLRWLSQLALAAKYPQIWGAMGVWNDYQEGNAWEVGYPSGKTLSLSFDDATNKLTWTDPGPVFDHLTLFLSQDGENLMPIADGIRGASEVPLTGYSTLPAGVWKFLLGATGKNSIQNVISSAVTVNEVVDWTK